MTTAKFSAWRYAAADSSETRFTMEMTPELVQAFNVFGFQTEPWYCAKPPAVVPPIPDDQLDEALALVSEIISEETNETYIRTNLAATAIPDSGQGRPLDRRKVHFRRLPAPRHRRRPRTDLGRRRTTDADQTAGAARPHACRRSPTRVRRCAAISAGPSLRYGHRYGAGHRPGRHH